MEMKAVTKKWQPEIRAFFSTIPWKNVLSFLFFLVLAFIFWLMLFFQKENVEGTYKIPLKYTHIPDDVVFDNPLPPFLEVSVSDNGVQIFLLNMGKRDSLEINVAETIEGGNTMLQGEQYRQLIHARLFPSTTIRGYYPMSIPLATSKLQSKELPVIFDGEITTNRANLIADSAFFIPETVMAYGSKQSLERLTAAETEYTVFNNLKATSQLPVRISETEGVKFIPSEVDIYIPIEEYTERTFEIPVTAAHVPERLDVKFFPSRVNVTFSVTLEEYRKIVPEDFSIELDYSTFHSNEDGRVALELTGKPASVINPRISPASVEFLFESRTN
jgi:hypothetical protein